MSALTAAWLLGRGATAKSITPLTLASDNTLTPGTLVTLEKKLEEYRWGSEGDNEKIAPLDTVYMNEVKVEIGIAMELREIVRYLSQPTLEAICYAYDYAQVNWTVGGKAYVFTGAIRPGYGITYVKGKNVFQMALGPVELATGANLTIT